MGFLYFLTTSRTPRQASPLRAYYPPGTIVQRQHAGNQNSSCKRVLPEPSRAMSRFWTYCVWQVEVNPSGTMQEPEQVAPSLQETRRVREVGRQGRYGGGEGGVTTLRIYHKPVNTATFFHLESLPFTTFPDNGTIFSAISPPCPFAIPDYLLLSFHSLCPAVSPLPSWTYSHAFLGLHWLRVLVRHIIQINDKHPLVIGAETGPRVDVVLFIGA